jgi:hypothetical protein
MPKRKPEKRPARTPQQQHAKRSPQEVYDYWTDEMMAEAAPVKLERTPPSKRTKGEKDDGDRS